MMTWEGEQILGAETILKKLTVCHTDAPSHDLRLTKLSVGIAISNGEARYHED